jgi:glycosyltransferase involved in cell wall biosynthesis
MYASESFQTLRSGLQSQSANSTLRAVVGITHPQTCLTLTGRLLALRNVGFEVTLVSSPGELLDLTAARQGAQPVPIPIRREIAPFSDLISLVRLWLLLLRIRPHLVEFSSPKAGLLGTLAALLARVPARVYMLRGLKLETATGFKQRLLLAAERLAAACSHAVLCNSESVRSKAIQLRIAPAAKLKLIGRGSSNGVDIERFCPGPSLMRKRFGIHGETPVIGYVGRLTRDKGIPVLIEAFEDILHAEPCARLLLIGWFDEAEDALSPALRSRIRNHPSILCTDGRVDDTAPYYRAMDVLVLPSLREGFPNAVLEAAATGIPVIATDCTGSRDSVIPNLTGMLIPCEDVNAIVDSVLHLLWDPARRIRMGHAARAWAVEEFSHERVLGLAVEFYKDLVFRRTRRPASA